MTGRIRQGERGDQDGTLRSMVYRLKQRPDKSLVYTFLSAGVRDLYGIEPLAGLADASLIMGQHDPADEAKLMAIGDAAVRLGQPFEVEIRVQGPDGGQRWHSLVSSPTVLPDGGIEWSGIEVDITRFKQREAAIRDQEYLFRESQRAANIGSYQTDFVAGCWASSEVLDQIFGIGPDHDRSVAGWLDIVHPDDREAMNRYLAEEVITQGRRFEMEYRIIRKSDGVRRWVLGLGQLSFDAAGAVVGMIGTIQDITQRKEDDYTRDRLLTAVEQADEAVVVTDPAGVMEYVNPAFERVSGYGRAEALGQSTRLLKSGLTDPQLYRELWATIGGGRTWRGRLVNRRKDGSLFTEEVTISPVFGAKGGIINYVAVKHDITERLSLESQYLQSQKMETVGRLAGGVAHDFNNMLSVIYGLTEMELMNSDPTQPLHASLQGIRHAAERSGALTKQLMAFARKQTIAPRMLDLNTAVSGMLAMLERLIGEAIRLRWRPAPGLDPVKLDPAQVDQVLANLCVNARDAIGGVGEVVIETANVDLDAGFCAAHEGLPAGSYVALSVCDNGQGMDADTLAQIFEPFFTTKPSGKGTGLGLAIVYGIAKQNHGAVTAASRPGQGTRFTLYLPSHRGAALADAEAVAPPPPSCRATVLLVEDEPALLQLSRSMLQRLGCTVLAAATPLEALALARKHAPALDLLLTDVVLPDMNGVELVGRVRTLRPDLKVLYMSGYTANIIAEQGVPVGGALFLQKPFAFHELSDQVLQALASD